MLHFKYVSDGCRTRPISWDVRGVSPIFDCEKFNIGDTPPTSQEIGVVRHPDHTDFDHRQTPTFSLWVWSKRRRNFVYCSDFLMRRAACRGRINNWVYGQEDDEKNRCGSSAEPHRFFNAQGGMTRTNQQLRAGKLWAGTKIGVVLLPNHADF